MTVPTPILRIYPLSQYQFAQTKSTFHTYSTIDEKLKDLYKKVETEGLQVSIELVIVVNDTTAAKSNPSILLFEVDDGVYRLPSGQVLIGEGEEDAIKRIFQECLGTTDQERAKILLQKYDDVVTWERQKEGEAPTQERIKEKQELESQLVQDRDASFTVSDLLFTTFRPHFDNVTYPYLAPHIKRPKQTNKTLLVELDASKVVLGVPSNVKLLSVPLFEIFGNRRFGALEHVVWALSRFVYH